MKKNDEDGLTISALEKELGIGKDTLRVWERRYGFPSPTRDAKGERRYPRDQVARLRLVRRLLDQGLRPQQVLSLPPEALEEGSAPEGSGGADGRPYEGLRELVRERDPQALQQALRAMIVRDGLERFVQDTAGPLVEAIGAWWALGELAVFEEHLATEQIQRALREALSQIPRRDGRPRVLITTLPGEPHALGLLLAEAVLRLDGAECTPLGGQTPESEIVAAARASGSDIVALSFSSYFAVGAMRDGIARLRAALPASMELWCGGAGATRLKRPLPGVRVVARLDEIRPELARWRS
jgi:DNA-binding transcriptional MerR regulator